MKIYMNKTIIESYSMCKTREVNNGNLRLIKPNTSLIDNYYINKGIKLFNKLPANIKLIDNDIKFKIMVK
jgi:hypothetical protein